ncbi:MAG: DUF883 domain-containing protein [Methylobacter sp.]|uniref:DUF883 domain-containing protein n=1 Tax=Methylobacter sp. TaxID=2051955 RepID=UPI002731E2C4|nr:DUF883 domain-containing protein [Methylobacter sp.]MDP1667389.1 DUF883 domain-containing protein [Methylobacter sp.]
MNTMEKASDYARETADNVADATTQAAKALGEKGEQLLNAERKLMKHSCNYVSDHPMTSLGIAAIIGFVLNRLLRNR